MKKKMIAIISLIAILILAFMVGTGFRKRTDVVLFDYTVSEDETAINLGVQVASSMGYVRGFEDNGGGVKPHYLTFYSTFGGLNSSFGTVNSFTLEIDSDDTEIYFNRPNGGYELVLVKDEENGDWIRPGENDENVEIKEVFTMEKLILLCDEGSKALKNAMTDFNEEGELIYSNFEKSISDYSLTWDYFCYVQYEGREYRIQVSYWKPEVATEYGHKENELDFINIFYPATNDGLLLYEADESFTPDLDIRSFLEKEYDLSLEVELELSEGLSLGNYQMDLVMGQGCLFVGDYEEENHGEGTPQDWYALGGIAFINKEFFPGDIIFENGVFKDVSVRMNHSGITSDIEKIEGCNKQAVLCEYSCDLFTAAEVVEYMQANGITEEEFHGNSTYWYVFMTEENDEKVYTLFLNQNYFTKEDIVKLAQSVKFK